MLMMLPTEPTQRRRLQRASNSWRRVDENDDTQPEVADRPLVHSKQELTFIEPTYPRIRSQSMIYTILFVDFILFSSSSFESNHWPLNQNC